MIFVKLLEKIKGVSKIVYIQKTKHLSIFYNPKYEEKEIKKKVEKILNNNGLNKFITKETYHKE